jgi:hypothetical protein
VGDVRAVPGQSVQHWPKEENYAHTEIFGDKQDEEIRQKLWNAVKWVIGGDS